MLTFGRYDTEDATARVLQKGAASEVGTVALRAEDLATEAFALGCGFIAIIDQEVDDPGGWNFGALFLSEAAHRLSVMIENGQGLIVALWLLRPVSQPAIEVLSQFGLVGHQLKPGHLAG